MKYPIILFLILFIYSCKQGGQSSSSSFNSFENVSIFAKTIAVAYNIDNAESYNELREKTEWDVLNRRRGYLYDGTGMIYIKDYTVLVDSLGKVKEVISYDNSEQVLVSTASLITDIQFDLPKIGDSLSLTYNSKRHSVLENYNLYPVFQKWEEQKCLLSQIDDQTIAHGGKIVAIYSYK